MNARPAKQNVSTLAKSRKSSTKHLYGYLWLCAGIKCVEKGLQCSLLPDRKRVSRTGKRIEQARGAFGSATDARMHLPQQQIGDEALEIISSNPWLESERSLGARLGTVEIQSAVTASLLERELDAPRLLREEPDWELIR